MQLNLHTILNELLAEQELTLLLAIEELPAFKTKLYALKKTQEDQLIGLEMLSEGDIKQLSFSTFPSEDQPPFLEVTLRLTARPRNLTYTILRKVSTNVPHT